MPLETQYRGFEISYNEDSDEWVCRSLLLSGKTLSSVKRQVQEEDKRTRRVGNVKALLFPNYSHKPFEEVTITLIEDRERGVVWVSEGRSRSKESISRLMGDTPETRKLIDEWLVLDKEAKEAVAKAAAFKQAIPRLKMADLATVEKV
jgi:hypothetical protein